jgi:hypothetical protein
MVLSMNPYEATLAFVLCGFCLPAMTLEANEFDVTEIRSSEITESSGLAASNRSAGHFWTHNDSGDGPKLYAFNAHGERTGSVTLEGAQAIDWEDMASFVDGDSRRLIVADVGDNRSQRAHVTLYLLDEPDPLRHASTSAYQEIKISYPDGPHDCEAIAVDVRHRQIWFVVKSLLPLASIYSMPLPDREDDLSSSETLVTLSYRGSLIAGAITGMDIDVKTGDVYLVNYLQCMRFLAPPRNSAGAWTTQVPEIFPLPKMKQIEAVAVDGDGHVWVTSEGLPAKFCRIEAGRANTTEVPK